MTNEEIEKKATELREMVVYSDRTWEWQVEQIAQAIREAATTAYDEAIEAATMVACPNMLVEPSGCGDTIASIIRALKDSLVAEPVSR